MLLLVEEVGGVEARWQLAAANAASVPHMKRADARSFLRSLERAANPRERVIEPPMEKIAHDPAAAAQWFAAMGLRTDPVGSA